MTKQFPLLLVTLLVILGLTACGNDDKAERRMADDNYAANDSTMNDSGTMDGGVLPGDSGTMESGVLPGDSSMPESAGENNTLKNDSTLTDATSEKTHGIGVPFDQMLRNGKVHDTDGDLSDYENAVTPGWAY